MGVGAGMAMIGAILAFVPGGRIGGLELGGVGWIVMSGGILVLTMTRLLLPRHPVRPHPPLRSAPPRAPDDTMDLHS